MPGAPSALLTGYKRTSLGDAERFFTLWQERCVGSLGRGERVRARSARLMVTTIYTGTSEFPYKNVCTDLHQHRLRISFSRTSAGMQKAVSTCAAAGASDSRVAVTTCARRERLTACRGGFTAGNTLSMVKSTERSSSAVDVREPSNAALV